MSARYAGGAPIAQVVRSGFVEGRHHGSIVVLDDAGTLIASVGDPHGAIFPRSSNKPLQAVAMLRGGLRLADPADLAVVAASHWAEPFHVERVRAMLHSAGLSEQHLGCPADLPIGEHARLEVLRSGGGPQRILMNCSGKHTGMLLTCVAAGWPTHDYLDPEHPLQKTCRATIEDLADEPVAAIGVDGCGAPLMAISLTGLARAFLRVASAAPTTLERRVADAMRGHPEHMSGSHAVDAKLMRGVPGLLSKEGAEGVGAVALPGVGAVAVKVDDGAGRARTPAMVAGLRRLGIDAPVLDELAESPVLGRGEPVGRTMITPHLLSI